MILELLQEINESRTEKGRGSKAGREKFSSKKGTKGSSVKSRKSRVKVYPTIKAALDSAAPYGHIFSTKSADRLYVITRPQWGKKSTAGGNTRVAKGFTPGAATPSASWPSIKGHAIRTSIKHGKISSSRLKKKYGAGEHRPEEKRYAGKPSKRPVKEDKKVNPWAVCHSSTGPEKSEKFERCVMKVKAKHGIKDWNEFKKRLSYIAETQQGQQEDILAAQEREKKEKKKIRPRGNPVAEAHPEVGGRASPAAMRTSFEDNPHMRPTSAQKSFMRTPGERIKTSAKVLARKVKGGIKKAVGAVKKAVGLGDWTRYEGTPLAEQAQYLQQFVESMPASQRRQTGTSMYRSTEDPGRGGGQGSQGTGNLPGPGVRRRRDVAAALKKASLQKAHTEYEGPSLREKLKYLSEKKTIQQMHAEYERKSRAAGRTPGKPHPGHGALFGRTRKPTIVSHTKYEGPSLAELTKFGAEVIARGRGAVRRMETARGVPPSQRSGSLRGDPKKKSHTGKPEGPSLGEMLEKVRRGVRAGATGSVTGGYLSVAGEKGTGRKVVGSWAQAKHRKPGSKVDPPITYAAKDHTEYEGPSLSEKPEALTKREASVKMHSSTVQDLQGRVHAKLIKNPRKERMKRSLAHIGRGRVAAGTEYEGPSLAETKDWIQGAVNPKHKGYCTPMTKKTCTPARKALAKRFKKAGRREGTKKGGKTGWKGKV